MQYCSRCGGQIEHLASGGCGGRGSLSGCPACNIVFRQTSGGILATPGGESYAADPLLTFQEAKLSHLERGAPHQSQVGDTKGQWVWSEGYYGETHWYPEDQQALAIEEHKTFVKSFEDSMPGPVHCERKARAYGLRGSTYRCRVCNEYLWGNRIGMEKEAPSDLA